MKYGLLLILISLLLLTACDDGLGEEDSYIKIPAIWGSSFDTGQISAFLTDSYYSINEVTGLWNPKGIAFDENEGIIFWSDEGYQQIVRYDPESREQTIIVSGMGVAEDLDFDPVERKIYWCDSGFRTISRCDEWGGSIETLLTNADGLEVPIGISLDIENRNIYFTDDFTGEIQTCNFDGSDLIPLVFMNAPLNPNAIAYHQEQGKIYWNDIGTDEIWRSNRDGSSQELLNSTIPNPMGLTIDEERGYLYYTYLDVTYKVNRCRLDGTQDEVISANAENVPFLDYGFVKIEQNISLNLPEFPALSF